jgi:hypothetical protein
MSFDFTENFTLELPDFSKSDIDFSESFNSKHGLIIEVAAIHEGLTSNYNNYSAEELEKALQSWVDPYPKPIILNHDLNTEAIGRVIAAKMDKEEDGSSFVRLQIAITDPVAAQKVLDKRYLTGSVGGRAGKAVCSVSGEDLASEDASGRPRVAKYKRGKVYKGKLAYVEMQDISFKEYSFVNQPADQKSGVRALKSTDGKAELTGSEGWVARSNAFMLSMDNEDIISIAENKSIFSEMKKKESKPIYLQLKGAFLTALSIQENENYKYKDSALLSDQNENIDNCQENSNMDQDTNGDDILAAVQELSDDLSTMSVAKESEDIIEEEVTISEAEVTAVEADTSSTVTGLQKVLADTLAFYFAAHRAHWNVEGEDFTEFHQLFSMIYEDAIGSIDDIAENLRKLQAFPINLTQIVMDASFKDDASGTDALMLAGDLLTKNNMVNDSVLSAFGAATAANEQGIANFLAERDDKHKKWAWQLRSSLKMEAASSEESEWRENGSKALLEKAEELGNQEVDSANSSKAEEDQGKEVSEANLTDTNAVSEQDANEKARIQSLEEENKKLKSALHRTLVERVVDTKIGLGFELSDDREKLIEEYATRTASSLADSLRDLAKTPSKFGKRIGEMLNMPTITSEAEVSAKEDNVLTVDMEEEPIKASDPKESFEQVLVDALMGRRKL